MLWRQWYDGKRMHLKSFWSFCKDLLLGLFETTFLVSLFIFLREVAVRATGSSTNRTVFFLPVFVVFAMALLMSNNGHKLLLQEKKVTWRNRVPECIGGAIAIMAMAIMYIKRI